MRSSAPNAGLRGPARDRFPLPVRAQARAMALVTTADVYERVRVNDGAGVNTYEWLPADGLQDLPARLDPVGAGGGMGSLAGDQVNEESTHVVHVELPDGYTLSADQQIEIDGDRWDITTVRRTTEGIAAVAEVRVA